MISRADSMHYQGSIQDNMGETVEALVVGKLIPCLSEYACRLRLIVSQTQVDFKAGEYVDPAYIAYIQE